MTAKTKQQLNSEELTEETENETNETLSGSDESIHHREEIKNVKEKQTLHSENKNKRG